MFGPLSARMTDLDLLSAELENRFELDELSNLSQELLGFSPAEVGGTGAKASFAAALVRYCAEHDAVEALCDALHAVRPELAAALLPIRSAGLPAHDELSNLEQLGRFAHLKRLGEGRLAISYRAERDGRVYRLKVLRNEATRDRRGLQRFLTITRLAAAVRHPALPAGLGVDSADGRAFVLHEHVDGASLAERARVRALNFSEVREVLASVLEALAELHAARLTHGDVRLENIIVREGAPQTRAVLLDAGSDRLRARPRLLHGERELFAVVGSVKSVAPEQLRGYAAEPPSDVYAFGTLLYELICGRPVFPARSALDAAFAHLQQAPEPPSTVAPRGSIPAELDAFVLRLLAKDPAARPAHARAVLEQFEELTARIDARRRPVTAATVSDLVERLRRNPDDEAATSSLEAAAVHPDRIEQVLEGLLHVAESLPATDTSSRKNLLVRSARVLSSHEGTLARAEEIYRQARELDPNDVALETASCEVLVRLGKTEEAVELLLAHAERATARDERARVFTKIGRLYSNARADREQALVAFVQAFTEAPHDTAIAGEIEQLAGGDAAAWVEVLSNVATAASDPETPAADRVALANRGGRWALERAKRLDLARSLFEAALASEPADTAALGGLAEVYRRAGQWPELVSVLKRSAELAVTPAQARDLTAQAAEILERELTDLPAARALYESILTTDPAQPRARSGLFSLLERSGNHGALIERLEAEATAQPVAARVEILTRIARLYEERLNDEPNAARYYERALELEPGHLGAFRGLERLHARAGRSQELLNNLLRQEKLAATPRQQVELLERIATLYTDEFLDPRSAAEAHERLLTLDPGHERSLEALAQYYRANARWEQAAELIGRHAAQTSNGERKLALLLQQAEILLDRLAAPERAQRAYEAALAVDPENPRALAGLARLGEASGDAAGALAAVEGLARAATTNEAKAQHWLRAARLLDARGEHDTAIDRYRRALDAEPNAPALLCALREAYLARGDASAALELLEREVREADGDLAKATLEARRALLLRERLHDDAGAEASAKRALALDPNELDALRVLADIAFERRQFEEASRLCARILERRDRQTNLASDWLRYLDTLLELGRGPQALAALDEALTVLPSDLPTLSRAAAITFAHGTAERAAELSAELLSRFGNELDRSLRAETSYRLGESLRRNERYDEAVSALKRAASEESTSNAAQLALGKIYAARGDWADLATTKAEQAARASGEERVQLLLELSELEATRLGKRAEAARSLLAALEAHPDDRRVLTRLLQLYGEDKEWEKVLDVVRRLADLVEDPSQRAKYLHTAAIVSARELADAERALGFYAEVLELEPDFEKAINESLELEAARGGHAAVERLLKRKLELASKNEDPNAMLAAFDRLGHLYEENLGWVEQALDAYEAAHTLDPSDEARAERLTALFATDPARYLERAVTFELEALRRDPLRIASYRALRRLYTETKNADAAWCVCQVLSVLKSAEADEERFYLRMRSETAAPAQNPLSDEAWLVEVMHGDADALLTSVFALIEAAVIARRGQPLRELGYDEGAELDLAHHAAPLAQNLFYAAGVLGIPLPPVFENEHAAGGVSFLFAHTPSLVLGRAALDPALPPQPAAFLAAQHLAYLRPGMYLRQLLASGTALKAWLFAAIRLTAPTFPIVAELEGAVDEALSALDVGIQGQIRDHLTRVVSKLLAAGAPLDLKRWVAAVDLTADRAGFLAAHDLDMALQVVRASDTAQAGLSVEERVKELLLYAVSPAYFEVRRHLGITIDA
jgi:tetratricopeptide (TPR) repeat protein